MASGYYNYDGKWLAASATPTKTIWGSGTSAIKAGAGSVELYASGQGELMLGGSGDDTFLSNSLKDQVVAGTNGVDTIIATVDLTMPAGVQNMKLDGAWEKVVGIGNSMANIITADRAGETIMGGGGDDVLVSAGGDLFLYAPGAGRDVIYNFHAGNTNSDVARLSGYGFGSFAQVRSAMTQVGSDVVLKLSSSDLIDFKNTTIGSFTAANFEVGVDTSQLTLRFDDEFNSFSQWNPVTKTGTWRTYYPWGGPNSESSHLIPNAREVGINVSSSFTGNGTRALGLNPFSISNGVLTITGAKTPSADLGALWNYHYTTGVITTQNTFAQTYGYFEARVQFPSTPAGLWPAFWLIPTTGGDNEIDVFETVNDKPNTVHETIHWDSSPGHKTYISFPTYVPNLLQGFHTYGLLWTPQTVTWFIDGAAVGSVHTPATMNKPMFMITNLSIGGNWPGPPNSTTKFPVQYKIDYIRAYSLGKAAQAFSASTTGSDSFYVHNSADTVAAAAGTPNESVVADVSYALPSNVQNLTVDGSGLTGTGGNVAGSLTSAGGANTLVAGSGAETFYVNNVGDKVVAPAGRVGDSVIATVSYTAPANITSLTVHGSGLTATANNLDDVLTSLGGSNTLVGGAGHDTFYVNNTGDKVVIPNGVVGDVIISSVSYALSGEEHVLRLTAPGLTATGNPAGANYLTSLAGGDTLVGGAGGGDVFTVSHQNDVIVVAPGTPNETVDAYASFTLPANVQNLVGKGGGDMTLVGNAMDNVITAGKGADILTGGGGNDTFVFAPGDRVETITDFGAAGSHDRIDISAYQKVGLTETFVDHGTHATIDFSNGDVITLNGVSAASLHVSGHYIL